MILTEGQGIGLLHGPESSGRLELIKQYVKEVGDDRAIASVDGARLKTPQLLSEILAQFGYDVELSSTEELYNMLHVFVVQQTRSSQVPVLILDNINGMYPSALCVLCKLASLKIDNKFALRIVLIGGRSFDRILQSPSMRPVADRLAGDLALVPLTANESLGYLYSRLLSHGVMQPDNVFSIDVCDELYVASGGWSICLDSIAVAVMNQSDHFPIQLSDIDHPAFLPVMPKLLVTHKGEMLLELSLSEPRILIGRSVLCDIALDDEFVSQHHAAIVRINDAVVILDLNSRNGTFVNSKRIQKQVLRDNDIVALSEHRIKMIYPEGTSRSAVAMPDEADTATMRRIEEPEQDEAAKLSDYWDNAARAE